MLRTESMEAWKSNAYDLRFQVKKFTLCSSWKWYIWLHEVLEVRWSSLMKRSWETPWSWTLTGWPRQTWNILFWSMKMYQGLWRIIKDYEGTWLPCSPLSGLVSLSAGCCQHLQLPPGSSRKCGTSKADGMGRKPTAFCQFHVNV